MSRPPRFTLLPGCPVHVLQRGHNKAPCFRSDGDRVLYLGLLEQHSKRYECEVHAYVLMTNHIHLLVSPPDVPSLSKMMQRVNQVFGQYVNRHQGRSGSVWQSRFKTFLVDSGEYFLTLQVYIELNPVRAGAVKLAAEYPWSSFAANAGGQASGLIKPHPLYLGLGKTSEARQAAYRRLLNQPVSSEVLAKIRLSLATGAPLGNDAFVRAVADRSQAGSEPVPDPCQTSARAGPGPGQAPVQVRRLP